jgi:predicted permease
LRPAALSRLGSAGIDGVVLTFAACTALFCGILFSFAPLIEIIRTDVIGGVLGNIRRIGSARYRARALLVTLQIAFGLVLLIGAGLIMRTFISIQQLDPGYSSEKILSFRLSPPQSGYDSQEAINDFHRRMQQQLASLPGVTGVGAVSHYPFDSIPNWGSPYLFKMDQDPSTAVFADFRSVSPGYLETVGARLLEGRFFTEADDTKSQPVVIVDDLLAKRSWPGESAVGKQIAVDPAVTGRNDRRRWVTVIGVVRHMRIRSLVEDLTDQVYMSIRQVPRPTSYIVRTNGDASELAAVTRNRIREVEPQVPVYDIRLLDSYLDGARAVKRFTMFLAAAFAGVALVLAFIGVYGLVTYSVNTRRYEFGVRLALGARSGHILRLAMREGIALLSAGLALGIAGAAVASRFLESLLFGVSALDTSTYILALAVIAAAGLVASWLPARKASQSNPLEVMRAE